MNAGPSWLPLGAVTGIGSLPCIDAREALQLIAEWCPEIPFWPQLPRRAAQEGMIEQALGSGISFFVPRRTAYGYALRIRSRQACLRHLSQGDAALTEQTAAGFFAFEQALASGLFPHAHALKGQCVGPLTLACQLFSGDQPLLFDPEALSALATHVTRQALWQTQRLQRWRLPTLCFLDEPCLALLDTEPYLSVRSQAVMLLRGVVQAIQRSGVLVGVHCCAEQVSFPLLCQIAPDVLSFDAFQRLETFCSDQRVDSFFEHGGLTAFGLVPTTDLSMPDASVLFARWLLACPEKEVQYRAARTLITATCGLGLLDREHAQASFQVAGALAALVKKVATVHSLPQRQDRKH
ncbi:hypothetical protein [Dictyobacter formicarum]|uniref:hypothetical protein n=1 Tax=Dictyobacter formicarum TaxID=2778368 RepID=UPI0019167F08|nr:hypothetical protein [Dictyobacter formicarum]